MHRYTSQQKKTLTFVKCPSIYNCLLSLGRTNGTKPSYLQFANIHWLWIEIWLSTYQRNILKLKYQEPQPTPKHKTTKHGSGIRTRQNALWPTVYPACSAVHLSGITCDPCAWAADSPGRWAGHMSHRRASEAPSCGHRRRRAVEGPTAHPPLEETTAISEHDIRQCGQHSRP